MTNEERRAALQCLHWFDEYSWHYKTMIGCAERLRWALMTKPDQQRYIKETKEFFRGLRDEEPSLPPELRPKMDWMGGKKP
jgi:hypothetical protein